MYARLLKMPPANKSFFLFGPRGTGKTSWVKRTLPDALYFDLLDDELYVELLANPRQLGRMIPADYQGWVVVDEVQRVPAVLHEVHRLIESMPLYFVLTGSSARSLRRKGVNLLAGRAYTYHMYPLVKQLRQRFRKVIIRKPSASRARSREVYLLGLGAIL